MFAETVYNVAQALPETEKLRLLSMLQADMKPVKTVEKKKSTVWTHQECMDAVLPIMMNRLKRN